MPRAERDAPGIGAMVETPQGPAVEPPAGKTAGIARPQHGRPARILMVAGEASGDMHGGDLAVRLRDELAGCEIYGIAGARMRAAGVRDVVRIEDIAGLGLAELSATIGRTLRALGTLKALLRGDPPDLAILIDYAEFNLHLAATAKRCGVPVLYYILPQVWAWRRRRIGRIIQRADRLAVVFPFEAELYAQAGARVSFVGHPLLDIVRPAQDHAATLARHGFDPGTRLLALLPGSRMGEVCQLLGPMVDAARLLHRSHGLTPCLALAGTLDRRQVDGLRVPGLETVRIIEGDTYSIIAASEVVLVASGTATLEAALLERPMVIAYRMSALSYAVGWALVRGVEFIGMPNILAGRKVVPELIQGAVTAANLARAAEAMLAEPQRGATVAALGELRRQLGSPGAAGRVARMAAELIR